MAAGQSFIFGGNTGLTYEQVQARRRLADQLRQQNSGTPKNVGEGIHALARGIVASRAEKQANTREAELRAEYDQQWQSLFGGAPVAASGEVGADGVPVAVSAGFTPATMPSGSGNIAALAALMGSPFASDGQRMIASTLLQQALARPTGGGGVDPAVEAQQQALFDQLMGGGAPAAEAPAPARLSFGDMGAPAAAPAFAPPSMMPPPAANPAAFAAPAGPAAPVMPPMPAAGAPAGMSAPAATPMAAPQMPSQGASYAPARMAALTPSAPPQMAPAAPVAAAQPQAALQARLTQLVMAAAREKDPGRKAALQLEIDRVNQQMAPQEPTKGVVVGDNLIDPITGKVIYDGQEPGFRTLSADEVKSFGLPPGVYQQGVDGRIAKVSDAPGSGYIVTGDGAKALGLDPANSYNIETTANGMRATQIGGGGVTVNTGDTGSTIGTIPQGYAAIPDANNPTGYRFAAIPGGPEDTAASDAASAGNRDTATGIITTAASRARMAAGQRVFGGPLAGVAALNPMGANAEIARQVEVLKSTAKIENLTAMRAASPTGGALGAVSDRESEMLAAKSGALDPASPNFVRDLDDYERTLLRIVHGPEAGDRIFEQTRAQSGVATHRFNPATGKIEQIGGGQ